MEETTATIQQLIDAGIEEAEKKAEALSASLKKKIVPICFAEDGEDGKQTGKVFTAFVQQPHFVASVKAMDLILKGDFFTAGLNLFDVMVIKDKTDAKILEDGPYKLGLLPRIARIVEIKGSELKKS